jgi:hypothetical protein
VRQRQEVQTLLRRGCGGAVTRARRGRGHDVHLAVVEAKEPADGAAILVGMRSVTRCAGVLASGAPGALFMTFRVRWQRPPQGPSHDSLAASSEAWGVVRATESRVEKRATLSAMR